MSWLSIKNAQGVVLYQPAHDLTGSCCFSSVRTPSSRATHTPSSATQVDPDNQYAWKAARIGQVDDRGQFKIVWSSEEPIRPLPFPSTRTREQWQAFLDGLQRDWGGRWEH